MSTAPDRIVAEALELPAPVRAYVVEKLIESLDVADMGELSPAWREEIGKRCKAIDDGLASLKDAEAVFERAYAKLG